jgi:hypothetical protein
MATMFLSNPGEMRKSYRGPSIDASCKLLLYLVKWFQRKRFLEIDQPKTRKFGRKHLWEVLYKVSSSKQNVDLPHCTLSMELDQVGLFT